MKVTPKAELTDIIRGTMPQNADYHVIMCPPIKLQDELAKTATDNYRPILMQVVNKGETLIAVVITEKILAA